MLYNLNRHFLTRVEWAYKKSMKIWNGEYFELEILK